MIAKSISKRSLLMEPQSGKQCDLGQACGTSNVTMASQLLRRHNYLVVKKKKKKIVKSRTFEDVILSDCLRVNGDMGRLGSPARGSFTGSTGQKYMYDPEQTFRQSASRLGRSLKIAENHHAQGELHSIKAPPSRIPNWQAGLTDRPVILTANHRRTG